MSDSLVELVSYVDNFFSSPPLVIIMIPLSADVFGNWFKLCISVGKCRQRKST